MVKMTVESGVPVPNKFPFKEMKVGDSFAIPAHIRRTTVQVAALRYGRTQGARFTVRKFGDGYRCWRIE